MKQFEQVLKGLGLDDAKIAELAAIKDDQLAEFKPDDYVNTVRNGLQTSLLNDANFLKSITPEKLPEDLRKAIEAGQYGRFMTEAKDYFQKTLGVDISQIPEAEQKSLKKLLEKSVELYGKKLGTPEALTKLQADLQKALSDKEVVEGSITQKLADAVKTEQGKYVGKLSTLVARSIIAEIPGLSVKAELVQSAILEKLNATYTLVFDENTLGITVKQKANPELDVMEGSKVLTFKEAVAKIAEAEGLIDKEKLKKKKEEEDEDPEKQKVKIEGDDAVPQYIRDKAKKNIEAEKPKK